MSRRLSFDEYQLTQAICLWAIDNGVADGNPWIIQLASTLGDDHGHRLRVWRQVGSSTFAEAYIYLHRFESSSFLKNMLTLGAQYERVNNDMKLSDKTGTRK